MKSIFDHSLSTPKNIDVFNDLLLPDEHFINKSGKDWIGICDTYNLLRTIRLLPDCSWDEYKLIKITNKRTYNQLVKDWIDREFPNVKNMDNKPSYALSYWIYIQCKSLKAGL